MSKGSCTESTYFYFSLRKYVDVALYIYIYILESIWDFLAELNIKPENDIYGVGQVEQFITKTLVKEQILTADNVKNANDDSTKTRYFWGPVAETSVSKKKLLDFYSQVLMYHYFIYLYY